MESNIEEKVEVETSVVEEEVKNEVVSEPEVTTEDKAREKGWRPQEEYEGDPEEWVDASEFLKREPLYKALHKANREIKRLKEMNVEVKKLFDDVKKTSKETAMKELKAQFEQAAQNNDVAAAIDARDAMKELEKEPESKKESTADNEIFNEWVSENSWYTTDTNLKRIADRLGQVLYAEDPSRDMYELYTEVTKTIKERYPDKFMNPNRKKPTSVNEPTKRTASNNNNGSKSKLPTFKQLPEDAKAAARKLIKSKTNPNGMFTEEEFMTQYIAGSGEIIQSE